MSLFDGKFCEQDDEDEQNEATMTNTPMTSREAFEMWHKSEYQGHNSYSYKHDTTAYIDDHVEIAFVAWEASQAQQAQVISDLVEALETLQIALKVGMPEYGYEDWVQIVDDALEGHKGK